MCFVSLGLREFLPFTWANGSVHGLGKWYTKFTFTFCKNQFHFPNNGREGLKLESKMAWRNERRPFGILRPEKSQVAQARNHEHRRASALLRNIQNVRICMGKKPIVYVTYENERISIKNSLPYLKCVFIRLSCVVQGPIYGRFMRVFM